MKIIETKMRESLKKEDIKIIHLSAIQSISVDEIIDTSIPIFFEDDAFNDMYIVLYTGNSAGIRSRIIDYVKSTSTITIADTLTISAGDVYGIVSDSSKWLQDNIGDFLSKTYLQTLKETIGMEDLPNSTLRNAIAKDTIYVDTINGSAGTDFPMGTPEYPINTFANAIIVADNRDVRRIQYFGPSTLSSGLDLTRKNIIGGGSLPSRLVLQDTILDTVSFENMHIRGTGTYGCNFRKCHLGDLTLTMIGPSSQCVYIENCFISDDFITTNMDLIHVKNSVCILNPIISVGRIKGDIGGKFTLTVEKDSEITLNGGTVNIELSAPANPSTLTINGHGEVNIISTHADWTIEDKTLQGRSKGQDAIYDKITSVSASERLLLMTSHRAVIEVGDSNEYILTVIDKTNGAIPTSDITLGTFDVYRVNITTHTGISTGNPLTKPENGSIVARYTHTSTDFDEGDGCRIIFRDIEVEIDGNTYILEPIEFQTRLSREKVIQDNVDTIITDVGIIDGNVDTLIDRGLSKTDGTTTYVALTGGEQDIINYTPASIEKINCIKMEMDNLTQNGEWKIYIEGEEQDSNTWATTDADGLYIHLNLILVENIKVSWTPAVAEAGDRVIPYSVRVEK